MENSTYQIEAGNPNNVIFESPHQNRLIPDAFQCYQQLSTTAEQRIDTHVDTAAAYLLREVGGALLTNIVSRLIVDLNRGADRVDSRVCPTWPSAKVYRDGGVIPPFVRLEGEWIKLYDYPLDADEIEERLRRFWYPYHERLQQLIDEILQKHEQVILISLHSTFPKRRHKHGDRPVIYLGTRNGETCDSALLFSCKKRLEEKGITAITEEYYQGAYTTQAYGKDERVNAIQIELDRRFLDPGSESGRVNKILNPLISAIQGIAVGETRPIRSAGRRKISMRSYFDPFTGEIQFFL
ncbi:MAG: hypothetical protein C4527_28065 [Candidatus Omnitrophota bacterium]|jgi:N-formylglutamate deformylase|nr:MAG: hypothetical protein C4527_28065 [Candidatus Omnitrophota bacterium]